jgi:hypothetical protein
LLVCICIISVAGGPVKFPSAKATDFDFQVPVSAVDSFAEVIFENQAILLYFQLESETLIKRSLREDSQR